jgi:hypothetical protein
MISAEDGLGPVILPRLSALSANLDNIAVYDEAFTVDPLACKRLVAAVEEYDAAVLFLDPMVVYMGGEVDSYKANEVRSILSQLTGIAKEKDIAIVCVHHVKKGDTIGQHKSLGSVDFVNGVRSTVLVDVSKTGTYYMSHVKSNWARKGPDLAYSFNDAGFYWMGQLDPNDNDHISRTPRGKAKTFLVNVLRDGPVLALDVIRLAITEGFNESTLQRAKRGVCHSLRRDEKWYWELDEGVEPPPVAAGNAKLSLTSFAPEPKANGSIDPLLAEALERMGHGNNR